MWPDVLKWIVAAQKARESMKSSFAWILTIPVVIYLSACSSQAPATSRPPIAAGSLDTAAAYLMRGDAYLEVKDYDHAIADYSQAIRLKPDYAEAYNNRGFAYSLKGKIEMPNAIADYSQAIQLRPDYAIAYNNRGVASMASGHAEEAFSDFNRALQIQPDFPQAYSNRGNYYLRGGQTVLAVLDFSHAEKIPLSFIAILCGLLLLGVVLLFRTVRRRRLAGKI